MEGVEASSLDRLAAGVACGLRVVWLSRLENTSGIPPGEISEGMMDGKGLTVTVAVGEPVVGVMYGNGVTHGGAAAARSSDTRGQGRGAMSITERFDGSCRKR